MSTLSTTNLKNPSSGSNNIVLAADGSTTIPTLSATDITGTTIQGTIKSGTAVASTSGTAVDFTGIPSWVKRITVMFNGVSTSGTSNLQIQLGDSGGIENTGYLGTCANHTGGATAQFSSGFIVSLGVLAADVIHGQCVLSLIGSNTWVDASIVGYSSAQAVRYGAGTKSLSDTLDRIRITTANGTDTFDAGSVNILFEG
jgi:hypothetical protein